MSVADVATCELARMLYTGTVARRLGEPETLDATMAEVNAHLGGTPKDREVGLFIGVLLCLGVDAVEMCARETGRDPHDLVALFCAAQARFGDPGIADLSS